MKNLMVYIHPAKRFKGEYATLAKIQIDNSLSLGWEKKDIVLATNFAYEYSGVESLVVGDDLFCEFDKRLSKVNVLVHLFESGIIEEGELYWFHDFDAFELHRITEAELDMGRADMAFTTLGYKDDWNTGSFFFGLGARDVVKSWRDEIYRHRILEEPALKSLTSSGKLDGRFKTLNVTYNFIQSRIPVNWMIADKPLKVAHFHPIRKTSVPVLDIFLRGNSDLGFPLLPQRLIDTFHHYGIK